MVLLEAMSCGVPVVTPPVGVAPRLIDDGSNGVLYQQGSKRCLAEALDSLLTDRPKRDRLGERARQTAVEQFSWERQAERLKQEYSELIEKKD